MYFVVRQRWIIIPTKTDGKYLSNFWKLFENGKNLRVKRWRTVCEH